MTDIIHIFLLLILITIVLLILVVIIIYAPAVGCTVLESTEH